MSGEPWHAQTATPQDEHGIPYQDAERLADCLARLGVPTTLHAGYGLALVWVRVGLVVWCDGEKYWWRAGWDEGSRHVVYAWHPATEPARAARRIALRFPGGPCDDRPGRGPAQDGSPC
ncbi:hypothetical protein [Nonomuraea pusilla]|uniref:Uncharacterized protein n=1 Tax=Nonomuraea pusilla TaxID=46177 RepID=A0A1H8ARE9_9ACTN|nr:hypothetical protein [Nonomuraea pusilla]SEM72544.1 hypothetical protein SAMN05660976_05930 [Nonomuraea pusilla]